MEERKNLKTLVLTLDSDGRIITPGYEMTIAGLFNGRNTCDFKLLFIGEDQIIDEKLNEVVRLFVRECTKKPFRSNDLITGKDGKNFVARLSAFLRNYLFPNANEVDLIKLDCFFKSPNRVPYFHFCLPRALLKVIAPKPPFDKEPQEVYSLLSPDDVERYVLPPFYAMLYSLGLEDDVKKSDLLNYACGPH